MKISIGLIAAAALLAAAACSRAPKIKDDDVFTVTVEKKPKEVVAEGPILIYRYNMSGAADYQWVYVPNEDSKNYVVSLLKALKVIKDESGVGVKTLAEVQAQKIVPGEHQDSHDQNIARLTADLQSHAAVVDSYENKTGGKARRGREP